MTTRAAKRYSRVHKDGGLRFRYNFESAALEFLDDDNSVIGYQGLSLGDWKDNPKYLVEKYADELRREAVEVSNYLSTRHAQRSVG